jgi:hypothetical protein
MEKKKEEQEENRFTYSSNEGLKILSEQEILDSIGNKKKKENQSKNQILGKNG